MNLSKRQAVIVVIGVAILLGAAALFYFGSSGMKKPPEVKLAIWGTESKEAIDTLTQWYGGAAPNVTVTYTQLPEVNYKQTLLDALAAGSGPDMFIIGNRDLLKEENKLFPVPQTQFTLMQMQNLFPATVESDFADGGYVYGLPLYLDTLALFYNKDLFDRAAVVTPPTTWNDFQSIVPRLRVLDDRRNITQAAAALGGSEKTVSNAVDILCLLMMQNGATMVDPGSTVVRFAEQGGGGGAAFDFYLQFANSGSFYYTWSDAMKSSLESFAAGKTAMVFGYKSDLAEINKRNPFLRVGVMPMPQVSVIEAQSLGGANSSSNSAVAYPRYVGLVVSRQSKAAEWAWDFIVRATTSDAAMGAYLAASDKPPALRSLIAQKIGNPTFDVFARQALIARSWRIPDDEKVRNAMDGAIRSVLTGQTDSKTALKRAADQVTQLIKEAAR